MIIMVNRFTVAADDALGLFITFLEGKYAFYMTVPRLLAVAGVSRVASGFGTAIRCGRA